MSHPFRWYPIHVAKTGTLFSYDGKEIKNWSDFVQLIKYTFKKKGILSGFSDLLFEKMFPLFALSQLPKTIEFWRERWRMTHEGVLKNIKGKKFTILEMGCGGGELLFEAWRYAKKQGLRFKGYGIDINADAIKFAKGIKKKIGARELWFMLGDIVKDELNWQNKTVKMKDFAKNVRPDLCVLEGVMEWIRPQLPVALENVFSMKCDNYLFVSAASKALSTPGGSIMRLFVRMSGEELIGFEKEELKSLLKKYCEKYLKEYELKINVCGAEWYPEAFYIVNITKKN